MSRAETLLWRFHVPLGRMIGALNRLAIGERQVRIDGDALFPDRADRWLAAVGWKLGLLARAERRLLAREVRPGMVAVDAGANLGLHTLGLARAVGSAGRVYALEPDPASFRSLTRAVAAANLKQVRLNPAAAGRVAGTRTLYRSLVSRGETGFYPLAHACETLSVPVVTLDDLLAVEPRVDLVKLDVQGDEAAVLDGARQLLARSPGVLVLCEVCPAALARAGTEPRRLFAIFAGMGLGPHRIAVDGGHSEIGTGEALAEAHATGSVTLLFRAARGGIS